MDLQSFGLLGESSCCAPHRTSVLITGPTGPGKEVIAREVHRHSARAKGLFVPVDCTVISGPLCASQLFGHRKGAFTGADYEAMGCFRAADGGTIFLDEIGELELELQAKLLRVLQERVVVPVGGHQPIAVDVRVVAATNRDLKQEVLAGRFREDLYYRLNVVGLETAPLRDRPADVPMLANYFIEQLVKLGGFPRKQLSPGALELLASFDWPGNVRQLRHLIERAVIGCDDELITFPIMQRLLEQARMPQPEQTRPKQMLGMPALTQAAPRQELVGLSEACDRASSTSVAVADVPWRTLADLEREHIRTTLEHTYYNQSASARLLGITRQMLIRKMKDYGINTPKARGSRTSAAPLSAR
jgi:DNA-binding NtrC family response regulator